MTRQGGQLVEEISRMTGVLDFMISFSKLLSFTLTILMSSAAFAVVKAPAARIAAAAKVAMCFRMLMTIK
jgi:hypothetical protein